MELQETKAGREEGDRNLPAHVKNVGVASRMGEEELMLKSLPPLPQVSPHVGAWVESSEPRSTVALASTTGDLAGSSSERGQRLLVRICFFYIYLI